MLEKYIKKAINTKHIPYKEILGAYLSESEALARW